MLDISSVPQSRAIPNQSMQYPMTPSLAPMPSIAPMTPMAPMTPPPPLTSMCSQYSVPQSGASFMSPLVPQMQSTMGKYFDSDAGEHDCCDTAAAKRPSVSRRTNSTATSTSDIRNVTIQPR